MKPQKKSAVANTTTFITGSVGKFFSEIKYKDDPALMNIIDLTNLTKEPNRALDAVLNDSGDSFASVDTGGHLLVFYLLKNRFVNICKDVFPTSYCFAEKNEGLLFLAMPGKTIKVYNLAGKQLQELKGHKNTINGLKVSHSRNLLLSYSHEACILWDLTTFKIYRTFHSKRFGYCSATFAPDGDALITFTQDSVITFFSISNSEVEKKFTLPPGSNIKKLAISTDSRYLAAIGNCPFIYVFDLYGSDSYTAYQLPSGCESVKDLKFIEKSRLFLLGGDNQIHCVDFSKERRVILTKSIKGRAIISFDVNVRGKCLVTVTGPGEIYLYDIAKLLSEEENSQASKLATITGADTGYSTLKPCDATEVLEATSKSLKKKTKGSILRSSISPGRSFKGTKTGTGAFGGSETFAREGGTTILMGKTQLDENKTLKTSFADKENLSHTSNAIQTLYQTAKLDFSKSKLNKPELEGFLQKFKVFPEKHRGLIWRTLLDLPLNNEAFDNLVAKGTHMAFHNLQDEYPIISTKILTKLQRILSALAHYCSVFGEVEYLPDLVFPFVKLFANEELVCFEIILSFFLQWGQHLLEFHPNPPSPLVKTVEDLLAYHETELAQHLRDRRINLKTYIWIFLRTTFTDILTRQDWLSLMDFLALNCHEPVYIVLFMVSYFSQLKPALLKTEQIDNVEYFIKKQSSLDMSAILDKMREYLHTTDTSILSVAFKDNLPISGNQYPFFNLYPKHSLEQRMKIKEEILKEDHRLFTQKEQNKEIQRLAQEVQNQENKLREKKEVLAQAEKDRRELKAYEEDMRLQQKLNLERDSRERRANQLKTLEGAIKNSLEQQELARTSGLKELQKDMQIKAKIDNHAIQSRLEEEALMNLEFTTAQKLNDIIEARKNEEKAREARIQLEHQAKQNRLREIAYAESLQKEEEEQRLRSDILQRQKLIDQNLQQETQNLKELTYQRMLEELQRDTKLQDIERQSRLRRIAGEGGVSNDEFMSLYQKHEQALKNEEEHQIQRIFDEERKLSLAKAEERFSLVERERRLQQTGSLNLKEVQKTVDLQNQRNEFEERLLEMRRKTQLKDMEEEKRMQEAISEIEQESRAQRVQEQQYMLQQRERQAREDYQRMIKENEDHVLKEESRKFNKFKEDFDDEIKRVDQSRNRDEYSRSYEASSIDRNNTMTNQTDDFRRSGQSYGQRYFDDTQRSEDRRINEFERSHGTRSNVFKSQDEVRIEDQARREEGQRTGTFQSPNSSKRNFGQSVSFYTYSDTANEDEGRRYESSYRGNRDIISEAQQILSKHQYTRPAQNIREKYYAEDEVRQPYSSTEMYQSQSNQAYSRGDERSPERFYQAKSGSSRGQTLQSSPDLTYSSHEGSAQKDWHYGYEES